MPALVLRLFAVLLAAALLATGCGRPKPVPLATGAAGQYASPPTMDARAATVEIAEIVITPEPFAPDSSTPPAVPTAASVTPTATLTATPVASPSPAPTAVPATATPAALSVPAPTETTTVTPAPPALAAWTGVPWVFTEDGGAGGVPWHVEGYNCKGVYGDWGMVETMQGTTAEGMKIDLQGELKGLVPGDGGKGPFAGTLVMTYSLGPVSGSLNSNAKGTMMLGGTKADPALTIVTDQAGGQATGSGPGMTLSMPFQGSGDQPYEVKIHPDPAYARCK